MKTINEVTEISPKYADWVYIYTNSIQRAKEEIKQIHGNVHYFFVGKRIIAISKQQVI